MTSNLTKPVCDRAPGSAAPTAPPPTTQQVTVVVADCSAGLQGCSAAATADLPAS